GMVLMAAHRSPKPRVWVQILVPLPNRACSTRRATELSPTGLGPSYVGFYFCAKLARTGCHWLVPGRRIRFRLVQRESSSMFTRMIENIKEFLSDVRNELKKVSFPTKAETIGSTTVVIVFCVLMSIYLSVI